MNDISKPQAAPDLSIDVPHSDRVWNYWLGGKDNFESDRAVGDMVKQTFPEIVTLAREVRAYLSRTVEYLAGEAGVRPRRRGRVAETARNRKTRHLSPTKS